MPDIVVRMIWACSSGEDGIRISTVKTGRNGFGHGKIIPHYFEFRTFFFLHFSEQKIRLRL